MPCRDSGPSHEQVMKERLDAVTRLLCHTMKAIEKAAELKMPADEVLDVMVGDDTKRWYERHKEEDRLREAEEQRIRDKNTLKKEALKKLSQEEKEALGLR